MAYAEGNIAFSVDSSFNGYFPVHLRLSLKIIIDDDRKHMHAYALNNTSWFESPTATRGGFIDFAGIAWDTGSFFGQGTCRNHYGGYYEYWPDVFNQMKQISGNRIPDMVIYGAYQSNDAAHHAKGEIRGAQSHTFSLNDSNFNADGTLRNTPLVYAVFRWYSSGQQGTAGRPTIAGMSVVNSAYSKNASIFTDDITWSYYPFATYNDYNWKSCNRDGGLVQSKQGNWQDRKNNYVSQNEAKNTVFVRDSNWKKASKIGKQ